VFRNRENAGLRLARRLQGRELRQPLVLAIPRGGLVVGAVLARELGAELDVVLSRKLRAPGQPELALGAVAEDGRVFLNHSEAELELPHGYLQDERDFQVGLIARRRRVFRAVRPPAAITGRSIIVTDDGIATGSTMIAALEVVRAQDPYEVIVAVPVASPERLPEIRERCDEVVCLLAPARFWAIGQVYEDFTQIDDATAVELLRSAAADVKLVSNTDESSTA
jgi:putative phosphoribosyl transferase